jgi:hypothetical protein
VAGECVAQAASKEDRYRLSSMNRATAPQRESDGEGAGPLNAELVPTEVVAGSRVIGEARIWEVTVPSVISERARLLLAPSLLSEAELDYLAAGTLPGAQRPRY